MSLYALPCRNVCPIIECNAVTDRQTEGVVHHRFIDKFKTQEIDLAEKAIIRQTLI